MASNNRDGLGPLLPIAASLGVGCAIVGLIAAKGARARANHDPLGLPGSLQVTEADIEALARMFASENGRGSERLHIELAWTQIRALRKGESIFHRITAGSGWGPQGERSRGGGIRPVATTEEATDRGRDLARRILDGQAPSTVPGARSFFEPETQNVVLRTAQKAREKLAQGLALTRQESRLRHYYKSADEVRASWLKRGQRLLDSIDGVEFYT